LQPEARRLFRLLDVLADANLIQRHAADSYRFHDLLRLYAAEHRERDPERDHARRRLRDRYPATPARRRVHHRGGG
jgi:hypothetical protein